MRLQPWQAPSPTTKSRARSLYWAFAISVASVSVKTGSFEICQTKPGKALSVSLGPDWLALMPGVSLVGAAIGSKTAKDAFNAYTKKQINDLAYQMTVDPKKFMEIYEEMAALHAKNPLTVNEFKSFIARMMARAGVISETE